MIVEDALAVAFEQPRGAHHAHVPDALQIREQRLVAATAGPTRAIDTLTCGP